MSCIAAVESYTLGAASSVVGAEQAPEHTGSSDDESGQQRAPLLDERIDRRSSRLEMLEQAGAFGVLNDRCAF